MGSADVGVEPAGARDVSDIGPPTSMGESVLREFDGLLLEFCGVLAPGDGEPALMEPPDCEADCAVRCVDDSGRSLSESRPRGLDVCAGLLERRGSSSSISPVISGDDSRLLCSYKRAREMIVL